MNRAAADILLRLLDEPGASQRALAAATGHSLGLVNRTIRELMGRGLLDRNQRPTEAAHELVSDRAPRNAIILAAGLGIRMAPINVVNPKALLEVHGEPLIERQIRQLHEVGIRDITVVVGFMKERFDYLIDAYGVELVVNPAYVHKNNLASVALVADRIANSYLVPCDVWCAENPFAPRELRSWYLVTDGAGTSEVRVNRKGELAYAQPGEAGNRMVGITYVLAQDAVPLRARLVTLAADPRYDGAFWEEALRAGDRMMLPARVMGDELFVEVNTYEQLRDLDGGADRLSPADIEEAARVLGVEPSAIRNVRLLKKGLMNSSFALCAGTERYVMRIPADRAGGPLRWQRERDAHVAIKGLGLCEAPLMLDVTTGHKLSRYLEDARPCDPSDEADVARAMATLRRLHEARLTVPQAFDLFDGIEDYEALRGGEASIFRDYAETKARVMALRDHARAYAGEPCLIHVDPAPENFLFANDGQADGQADARSYPQPMHVDPALENSLFASEAQADGQPDARSYPQLTHVDPAPEDRLSTSEVQADTGPLPQLIDWEYAGMGDPHVDVALFCIYSLYDRTHIDRAIDLYFAPAGGCDRATRAKIYCYVAAGGLLWSNWCEYKWHQGVEFGEYSLRQYRYAKDFARLAASLFRELEEGAGPFAAAGTVDGHAASASPCNDIAGFEASDTQANAARHIGNAAAHHANTAPASHASTATSHHACSSPESHASTATALHPDTHIPKGSSACR